MDGSRAACYGILLLLPRSCVRGGRDGGEGVKNKKTACSGFAPKTERGRALCRRRSFVSERAASRLELLCGSSTLVRGEVCRGKGATWQPWGCGSQVATEGKLPRKHAYDLTRIANVWSFFLSFRHGGPFIRFLERTVPSWH